MISLEAYWMGRDKLCPGEFTAEVQKNGAETVRRINLLLDRARASGIARDTLAGGWRPRKVNERTCNAAKNSNHILALAGDVEDEGRELAQWIVNNPNELVLADLWIEDPRWTVPGSGCGLALPWVHCQTIPPRSGKRIFIPNSDQPKGSMLKGQRTIPFIVKA